MLTRCAAGRYASCRGQADLRCSSKVQQLGRLTSDLHRPDTTLWPAPATFMPLATDQKAVNTIHWLYY
jgi:hypothetical protein